MILRLEPTGLNRAATRVETLKQEELCVSEALPEDEAEKRENSPKKP